MLLSLSLVGCVSRQCPNGKKLVDDKCVSTSMADDKDSGTSFDGGSSALEDAASDAGSQEDASSVGVDVAPVCQLPLTTCWRDGDADGFALATSESFEICGACPSEATAIEPVGDAIDCDDADVDVRPLQCWPDSDMDGYPADVDAPARPCAEKCGKGLTSAQPVGSAVDCEDTSDEIHPVAVDVCNDKDDDCDGDVDEGTDTMCSLAHASSVCAKGKCKIDACKTGFADCDDDDQNGCEQALDTADHCGGCGVACDVLAICNGDGVGHCECQPPAFGDGTKCQGLGPLSAGATWSCVIGTDSTIDCWGGSSSVPAQIADVEFRQISASWPVGFGFCGTKLDGSIACAAMNTSAAFSDSDPAFIQVVVGGTFACGLNKDLRAACYNLSTGDPEPTLDSEFTSLAAGAFHTCGLHPNGTAECWVLVASGECAEVANCPEAMPPSDKFVQIAAGGRTTCGLMVDGLVKCWGLGKLANGGALDLGQALPPEGVEMTWITVGEYHACGIRADDGKAVCWGAGKPGASGTNHKGQSDPPDDFSFLTLTAGRYHTCGLTTQNEIECWGDNSANQCDAPPGQFPLVPGAD